MCDGFELVKILWNYMQMNQKIDRADCIIALGSCDTSVAHFASNLYLEGYADKIIFTGGLGKITKKIWDEAEADKFAEIAVKRGVSKEKIYIERNSTNTGDNFRFSKALIEKENLGIKSAIIACKPYCERRAYAAFKKIMPEYDGIVASRNITPEEYYKENEFNEIVSKDEWINVLVGDVQRMKVFAEKDWQINMDIPVDVWNAYEQLAKSGFDKYVIKE